jgi:hypothetical protein
MSNHKVVAAIDFGTHGSGFAWAVVNEINRDMTQREIFYFDQWDAQQVVYPKNLSALLLDKAGNLLDWGYKARERMYSERLLDGRRYETNYKMSLQQNIGAAGTLANQAAAKQTTGEISKLITHCIRKVYEKALEHITSSQVYTAGDILWCITVPAIWDGYAKDLMRAAAVAAGLPSDPDRLLIALEPEAAALYCIVQGNQALTAPGCRLLMIDAGGGTVDITSYQVDRGPNGARLSELGTANGDKAGSEYLNKFFVSDVLCDRFGTGFVATLEASLPTGYYELMGTWEQKKRGVSATSTRPINLPLPAELYAHAVADGKALARIRQRQGSIDTAIVIPVTEVHQVFEKAVAAISDAVSDQLAQMRSASGVTGGEIAILVGGFAESPYLQERLRDYLAGEGVKLQVPPRPSVAVMTGATHYAYDPSVIRARRTPFTYGSSCLLPFRKGTDPDAKIEYDDKREAWCKDRFNTFVTRDGVVETDECVSRPTRPLRSDYRDLLIEIFQTKLTSPTYTTESGVDKVAELTVNLGSAMSLPLEQRTVDIRLYFGETEIRVEAENLHTKSVHKARITWKPTW